MIDTSPAIEKSGTKVIYVRNKGITAIISDGKNKEGKWHIIDMVIGNTGEAIQDLRSQGYTIKSF